MARGQVDYYDVGGFCREQAVAQANLHLYVTFTCGGDYVQGAAGVGAGKAAKALLGHAEPMTTSEARNSLRLLCNFTQKNWRVCMKEIWLCR